MLQAFYKEEPFVHVLAKGQIPHTRHVRGSNFNLIAVFDDRLSGRAIIISGIPYLHFCKSWRHRPAQAAAKDTILHIVRHAGIFHAERIQKLCLLNKV